MVRPSVRKCLNCRRLHIKCDLKRPCEYCVHRNRECVYPDSPTSTKSTAATS
ncbi:hypothetical protein DIRU0_C20164 [Diutina rugosa]